jgi:hypothetical protein
MKPNLKLLAALASLVLAQSLSAQVISWSFNAWGFDNAAGNNGGLPVPNTTAGVVPATNWNDVWNENGTTWPSPAVTVNNLWDIAGLNSGASLTYHANGIWRIAAYHVGPDADGTYNRELLNGYLDSASPSASSVAISSIPYPAYSIIVYLSSDTAGRVGTVSVGGASYHFSTMGSGATSGASAVFQRTSDTNSANPGANYAIFTNLGGSTQTITTLVAGGGGIAGFQIVSNAETAVSITSQPPATAVWRQSTANSLEVAASGAPIYYQWRSNSVDIPGATNAIYRVAAAQFSDAGAYSVRVYNDLGSRISSSTIVTISNDTNPPALGAVNSYDGVSVGVKFSELLDAASATTAANYSVTGTTVASAALMPDGQSVALTLSAPISGSFVVAANNIKDLAGNVLPANSKATNTVLGLQFLDFSTFQSVSATYTGYLATIVAGGADTWGAQDTFDFAYLTVTNDFDYSAQILSLTDGGGGSWTRAGIMVRDQLDSDTGSGHEASMMRTYGNLFQHLYRAAVGGSTTDNANTPAAFGTNSWVRLARTGTLFRGYYSSNGVDWVQNMQIDGATIGDASFTSSQLYLGLAVCAHGASAITTSEIKDFGPTPHQAVSITTQPAAAAVWLQGTAYSLSVVAAGNPVFYQWQTNGVAIPGATNAIYSVASASIADAAIYTVLVYNELGSVLSSNAIVSISRDTNAPFVNRVISYDGATVWVEFNEPLDSATAQNPANYTVAGATVTSAVLGSDGKSVTLQLSAAVSGYVNLTVSGVKDAIGNATSSAMGATQVSQLQTLAFGDATNQNTSLNIHGDTLAAEGGGSDIYFGSDNFAFFYFPGQFASAFDYRVRVLSVPDAYGGDSSRVLLMARDANNMVSSNVQAAFVCVCVANGANNGQGLIQVLYRRNGAAGTETNVQFYSGGIPNPAFGTNNWLRLQRVDNSFNTYWSTNGSDWNFILNIAKNNASDYFPTNVYLGLAVCSHTSSATTLGVASDLGITSNSVPRLSVSAAGSSARLNWPIESSGYRVQSTTNLGSPAWTTEAGAPTNLSGRYQVTVPLSVPAKYFRLFQQ